jgi:Protein of unknown function (DUF2852)
MYTAPTSTAPSGGFAGKLHQAEAWLDRKGKFAWFAAMILGFILFWPVGLALLAYMIWSKRMFSKSCGARRDRDDRYNHSHTWDRHGSRARQSSGNAAFDTYKADALRRLEDEQEAFEAFIQRLRDAKDKAQFDSFMEDRARANSAAATEPKDAPDADSRGGAY